MQRRISVCVSVVDDVRGYVVVVGGQDVDQEPPQNVRQVPRHSRMQHCVVHLGREAGREGEREGGREGGRQGGREGGREGGRQGGREGGRQAGREGGREGRMGDEPALGLLTLQTLPKVSSKVNSFANAEIFSTPYTHIYTCN